VRRMRRLSWSMWVDDVGSCSGDREAGVEARCAGGTLLVQGLDTVAEPEPEPEPEPNVGVGAGGEGEIEEALARAGFLR
jgi:hypothetical protein